MGKVKIISRILLAVYIAAICVICFTHVNSGIDLSSTWFGLPKDKVIHFTMFLPYPLIMHYAFYRPERKTVSTLALMAAVVLLGCIIAGATELVQGTLSYRSADINDFRADSYGILTGAIITCILWVVSKRRRI